MSRRLPSVPGAPPRGPVPRRGVAALRCRGRWLVLWAGGLVACADGRDDDAGPDDTSDAPGAVRDDTPGPADGFGACADLGPSEGVPCEAGPGSLVSCLDATGVGYPPFDDGLPESLRYRGAAIGDADGDGWPDVYAFGQSAGGALWMNCGGLRFVPAPEATLGPLDVGQATGALWVDLVGDARPELVVTHADAGFTTADLSVFTLSGDGTVEEIARDAGFELSRLGALARGVQALDADSDGRTDLIVRAINVEAPPYGRSLLFRGEADGTWSEVGLDWIGDPMVGDLGVSAVLDAGDDGHPDLVLGMVQGAGPHAANVVVQDGADPPTFGTVAPDPERFGTAAPLDSDFTGAAVVDADLDGRVDLVMTVGSRVLAYRIDGPETWLRTEDLWGVSATLDAEGAPYESAGVGAADLDADGWPDLVVTGATPVPGVGDTALLWLRNDGDALFTEVWDVADDDRIAPPDEHGLALSDLDRDGRVDLWTSSLNVPPRLLHNQLDTGASLGVRLVGHHSVTEGLGAQVEAEHASGFLTRGVVDPGAGAIGSGEPRVVLGLGDPDADALTTLRVRWPSGVVQEIGAEALPAGSAHVVVEEPVVLATEPAEPQAGEGVRLVVDLTEHAGGTEASGVEVTVRSPSGMADPVPLSEEAPGRWVGELQVSEAGVLRLGLVVDGEAWPMRVPVRVDPAG